MLTCKIKQTNNKRDSFIAPSSWFLLLLILFSLIIFCMTSADSGVRLMLLQQGECFRLSHDEMHYYYLRKAETIQESAGPLFLHWSGNIIKLAVP